MLEGKIRMPCRVSLWAGELDVGRAEFVLWVGHFDIYNRWLEVQVGGSS